MVTLSFAIIWAPPLMGYYFTANFAGLREGPQQVHGQRLLVAGAGFAQVPAKIIPQAIGLLAFALGPNVLSTFDARPWNRALELCPIDQCVRARQGLPHDMLEANST